MPDMFSQHGFLAVLDFFLLKLLKEILMTNQDAVGVTYRWT